MVVVDPVEGEENAWCRRGWEGDSDWWVPEDPEGWVSGREDLVLLALSGRRWQPGPRLWICGKEIRGRVGHCLLLPFFPPVK